MPGLRKVALVLLTVVGPAVVAGEPAPRYLNSHRAVLVVGPAAPFDRAFVWLRPAGGSTWESTAATRAGGSSVQFDAPGDGAFDFYLVLENAAGASAGAPGTDSRAHGRLVFDTAPPTLQVHRADVLVREAERVRTLRVFATVIEEHLGESGIRLFFRSGDAEAWRDAGNVALHNGAALVPVPDGAAGSLDVRLVVTDRAGNRVVEEVADVVLPALGATDPDKVATLEASAGAVAGGPVAHTVNDRDPDEPSTPAGAEAGPPAEAVEEMERLADRAAHYLARRQFGAAAEQLERAVGLAPQDPVTLAALGNALRLAGRLDDAERRFATAVEAAPEHVPAHEGLALVAVAERRYADARQHLERLLELRPEDAGFWLRLGDVDFRLGNERDAVASWQRVLDLPPSGTRLHEHARKRLEHFARDASLTNHASNADGQVETGDRSGDRRSG